jgi:hypothetical protein
MSAEVNEFVAYWVERMDRLRRTENTEHETYLVRLALEDWQSDG